MSRCMRVCRIITRLNVGGPAKQVEVLNELPVETLVIAGQVEEDEHEYEIKGRVCRVSALRRRVSVRDDWRAYREIKRHIREFKPDLVHTHTSKAGLLGRVAAWRLGVPSVHTYHGHVFHSYFVWYKTEVVKLVEKILGWITSRIIAICPSQEREIVGVVGCGEKTRVVWNGFDLEPFRKEVGKVKVRYELGWDLGEHIAIFVGRTAPIKRFDKFVRYCEYKDCIGIRIGDWSTSQLALAYKGADEMVICSDNEGTPTSYVEARVSGCPITLLSLTGGLVDLVRMDNKEILETFDKERLKKDIMELYKEVVCEYS